MKNYFFMTSFMLVGLLLQVGQGFARNNWAEQGQAILNNIERGKGNSEASAWKPTGPTEEDILASTRVDNLAAKGSLEEKIINAAQNGDHKNIATLIAAGAGLEARDNQDRTALMRAAEKGYADIVRILLDAGADVSAQDKYGWTALFMAATKNHVEVVKILIARGAASDKSFESVFVSSVFEGNIEMVKALVGEGAHISRDTIYAACGVLSYRDAEMVDFIKHLKSQCKSSE